MSTPVDVPAEAGPVSPRPDPGLRRAWQALFLLACAGVAYYVCFGVHGTDPDYFWHLRSGELMLLNHVRFDRDIFSWTFLGRPWLDHEWLAQIAYALADRLGGYPAVRLLHGLLVLGYLVLLWRILLLGGLNWSPALGLALLAGLGSYAIFLPRPQTVSVLGVACYAYIICRPYPLAQGVRGLTLLPLLIIPWANCHAGFLIGIGWLALAALGEALQRWRPLGPAPALPPGKLLLVTIAGAVAGLATPHGLALYQLALRSLTDPHLREMNAVIGEWRAPGWYEAPHLLLLCYMALVACAIWASANRPRWTPLLWAAVACGAATQSIRHLPFAWVALTVLAAQHLAPALSAWRHQRAHMAALVAWCVLVTALAGLEMLGGWAPRFPSRRAMAVLQGLPADRHLLNAYDWGGIFIYYLYPRQRVYIDGRLWTLYDAEHLRHYYTITEARPGWQELLARQQIDLIAVPPAMPIAAAAARLAGWHTIYQDETAAIVVRG